MAFDDNDKMILYTETTILQLLVDRSEVETQHKHVAAQWPTMERRSAQVVNRSPERQEAERRRDVRNRGTR